MATVMDRTGSARRTPWRLWRGTAGAGRRLAIVACSIVVALAMPGCGGGSEQTLASGSTLRVGYSFPFDSADLAGRLAFDRYARARHINVKLQQLAGAPNAVSSLRRGDIDLASLNLPDAIKAIGQGAKLHVILGSKMFPEYVFVATPGTTTARQLKGKSIAIQGHGSDTEAFTKLLLKRAGLSLGDANITIIPNSTARVAALVSKRIDATALRYHEYLRVRQREPGIQALAEMQSFEPMRMTQVWVVTDQFARRNRRQLQTLVSDLLAGYAFVYGAQGRSAWIADGQRDVFRGDPPSIPAQVYAHYRALGMWPRTDRPITAADYQRQLNLLVSTGQVPRPSPFRTVWDPSFWERAAQVR
jgi:ABC-type nitrate/sulfonate/bicarbonate transport system substrate-binding protein